MKRLNPLGSLLGFLLTLLLFVGLGFSLWFNRGLAFSPGRVTAKSKVGLTINGFTSHADFEKQCVNCHAPLVTDLAGKCLACHQEIDQQITASQGVHSQFKDINQCAACHPDHKGRSFDPTVASFTLFDHSTTDFSLNWHQVNYDATPLQCTECHKNNEYSLVKKQVCLDCHSARDTSYGEAHVRDFGSNCLGCHDGQDRMIQFEHSHTGYPLDGKHGQIRCADCHASENIKNTPKDCKECHAEPSMHKALFDQSCDTCHTPQGWKPAALNGETFEHFNTTGFSLNLHQTDYSNQTITCVACHPTDLNRLEMQTCIVCHTEHDDPFMADHQQQYGSDCTVCHDGVDRLNNFVHATFFPLNGKHAEAQCEACHANQIFRGTSDECYQCHKEPDIHAGVFGLKCFYCHTADTWSPASLQQHTFPVNHGVEDQGLQLQCDACHGSNYIDYSCYSCHDHQPDAIKQSHIAAGIKEQDIPKCAACHPTGLVDKSKTAP